MSSQTLLFIILAGIIALALALFQYKTKSMSKKHMLFALLRFLSVFSVLLLLINPKFDKISYYTEKPNLVIAVDNSSSVKHLKQDENVLDLIEIIKKHKALNTKFNLNYFGFGRNIESSDTFTFKEKQTNIDQAFTELKQIYKNTNAPTLLISDGNQTYGNDYQFSLNSYKQPVYTVILGDTITYTDLKIQQLNVNKYAFLKNKFPVEVIATYNGNQDINTRLEVRSGKALVYSKNLSFSKTNNSTIINFTLPANRVGVEAYKARLIPLENEKNIINNTKDFAVEVIDQKTNIAIISDFNHPDIGAFKKSIESNEQRSVLFLKPNDFLDQKDDYQLVILFQPNNRFKSVFDYLSANNSNRFVITGPKTDWRFLNSVSQSYKHEITNLSEDYQAILNTNYSTFIVDDLDFESFPPLKSTFGEVSFSTPFDLLLSSKLGSINTNSPLLATFESNGKREAVLFGENIWQWRAQSFLNTKSFDGFDNFIGKIIQYLASNKRKDRLNIDHESFYQGNNNVIIKAQFFNKNYEFDARETLRITVKNKQNDSISTYPFVLKNNNYQVDLSHLPASSYSFTVKASNENISKSGDFQILEYHIEQQFLNANVTKLQQVATNSNGESYFIANYTGLINNLLQDERFTTVQKSTKNTVPLLDWKLLLIIILLCLSIEWFLRKYNGLI